jgi:hypothetical protein
MQYGSVFSFMLKCNYFVFLVNVETAIDVFNHFANHRTKMYLPIALSHFHFEDANNRIFDRYMLMS